MSYLIIRGYKVKTTDLVDIENILRKIKSKVLAMAEREYKKLLVTEIENLYDDIALNKVQRPNNASIFDTAVNTLNSRIKNASIRQLAIEYNFNLSVHIFMTVDTTYIKVNSSNFIYANDFKEISSYYLTDVEALDRNNAKTRQWNDIMQMYENNAPLGVTLISGNEICNTRAEVSKLKFSTINERIERQARHEMTTRLINMYADYKQIPSIKLMEYTEAALMRLDSEDVKEEYAGIRSELKKLILPIDMEVLQAVNN